MGVVVKQQCTIEELCTQQFPPVDPATAERSTQGPNEREVEQFYFSFHKLVPAFLQVS